MKWRCLVLGILMTVLAACGSKTWHVSENDLPRRTEILDLFEAYFRYLMRAEISIHPGNDGTIYLMLADKNPPSDFLDRFAGHFHTVKKGSEYRGRTILYLIRSYEWVSENSVKIIGGFYHPLVRPTIRPYLWERKHGKWHLNYEGVLLEEMLAP